jgi:hypothetical protein
MTFLHPWIAWLGVAAVGVPVVVHWLTRPRPVRMPLSTLRFVREAIQQRRARHRLRDLIILTLRTLAVVLLAAAMARPQLGPRPLISDGQTGDTVRVVVLDVSQSMAAADRGIQAIERARTVAAEHLRYRPGLWANLIVAGAVPRAAFEQVSTNFDALREELSRCQVLPQRMDVRRAIASAAALLAPGSGDDTRRRELVAVSDFQRSSWASADFSPLPEGTQIQLESVAPAVPPANLAILGATCHARSAQGQTAQLAVEVGNYSPTTEKVTVEVAVGEATYRLSGTCPAGRRVTLTEEIPVRQVGWQSGEARLAGADDALAADNERPLVVRVRPKPVYALLTRQPASLRPSSSHFLECALVPDRQPAAGGSGKDDASATVTRIDPAQATAQAFAAADLIALEHPGKLSDDTIKVLSGLMRRGRPILYVTSEVVDATNLKRLAEAAGSGLQMPVEFLPPPPGQSRRDLFLTSIRREDRPFSVFGDNLEAISAQLRFSGGLSSRRLAGGLENDLAAVYDDGTACLVVTSSDAGVLAVLNADLAASNLPKTQAFVPLVSELIERMLDRERVAQAAPCGEPLVVHLPSDVGTTSGLRVVGPKQETATAAGEPLGDLMDEAGGVVWHWQHPTQPGVYRVLRGDQTVFAIALGVPAEESQLESLSSDVLTKRLAAGHEVYLHSATAGEEGRDDVWKWFVTACVLCLVGELGTLLAFRT